MQCYSEGLSAQERELKSCERCEQAHLVLLHDQCQWEVAESGTDATF